MNHFTRILCLALCLLPCAAHGAIVNIADCGAAADTTHNSAHAIQAAIDSCARAGGGTVVIPAGKYMSSTVWLDDNVTLHFENGSVLYASRKLEDYEGNALQRGAGDMPQAHVLIGAVGKRGIGISGHGIIDCRAERYTYLRDSISPDHDNDRVTGREVRNAHRYGADYRTKWRKTPPYTSAVFFVDCSDVALSDVSIREANGWSVHLQWCKGVRCRALNIYSDPHCGVNADGLDIDGCADVMVTDCEIRTGDDALCLKTTLCGNRTEPCRNVTVKGCILQSSSAAFKLGTESHADFSDIIVDNCIIDNANRGLNMIIRDGGAVRNVIFSNLIIRCARKETFWWGNGDPLWFTTQQRGNAKVGSISNIIISNIIAYGQSGVRFEGFDSRITDVSIDNFTLHMQHEDAIDKRSADAFLFDGVDNLDLRNCEVVWDTANPESTWQSAFHFKDATGLRESGLIAPAAPGSSYPAIVR